MQSHHQQKRNTRKHSISIPELTEYRCGNPQSEHGPNNRKGKNNAPIIFPFQKEQETQANQPDGKADASENIKHRKLFLQYTPKNRRFHLNRHLP